MTMSGQKPRATFNITLRDEPGQDIRPVATRLKQGLKALLRGFGFRCTQISEAPVERDAEQALGDAGREAEARP
jgi:hypothetical protein